MPKPITLPLVGRANWLGFAAGSRNGRTMKWSPRLCARLLPHSGHDARLCVEA